MSRLVFRIEGKQGGMTTAVRELEGLLRLSGDETADILVQRRALTGAGIEQRNMEMLLVTATFLLSIPGAVLACLDLADRIRKRKKAQEVLDKAIQIQVNNQVNIFLDTPKGPVPVQALDADKLLEIANQIVEGGNKSR